MLVAQISDFHVARPGTPLHDVQRTHAHLERAVAHLEGLEPAPDLVVASGDLVEAGTDEEYGLLREILAALSMPLFALPGNHDEREAMRRAFAADGYLPGDGLLDYAVDDAGPVRLLCLDTNVPGAPGGALRASTLSWLARTLAEDDRPTMIVQHHPPFRTGMHVMDAMGLDPKDAAAEAEIIRQHSHVERIACGHLHRSIVRRFAGTIASTCPSTSHQLELDLRAPGRLAVVSEPPVCQLHLWSDQTGLVTHESYIGDHGEAMVVRA